MRVFAPVGNTKFFKKLRQGFRKQNGDVKIKTACFFILILVRYFCVFSFAHIPLVKISDFH